MTKQQAKAYFKEYADKQALLASVSGNLTRVQREIVKLVDIEGLTLDEASQELNISMPSLKVKRDKAFKIIGQLLNSPFYI